MAWNVQNWKVCMYPFQMALWAGFQAHIGVVIRAKKVLLNCLPAEHGRRRHELLGAQPAPPLGRTPFDAASVRFPAALLAPALAAAAADPAVPGDVAFAAVVQVVAELGGEVTRGRVILAEKSMLQIPTLYKNQPNAEPCQVQKVHVST